MTHTLGQEKGREFQEQIGGPHQEYSLPPISVLAGKRYGVVPWYQMHGWNSQSCKANEIEILYSNRGQLAMFWLVTLFLINFECSRLSNTDLQLHQPGASCSSPLPI